MKINEKSYDYLRNAESIEKEINIQNRLCRRIKEIKSKIVEAREEIKLNEKQESRTNNLIEWYNSDIEKYLLKLENSKSRERFYQQNICSHDFGIITLEYMGDDGKLYQDGFCLDCDLEIHDGNAPIFTHALKISEVINSLSFQDYKNLLEELKRISDYDNNDYDYIIGEKIMDEIKRRTLSQKKK